MFGVKFTVPVTDPRFNSHPFVPVAYCNVNDKAGTYMRSGSGCYKQTSPTTWAPVKA